MPETLDSLETERSKREEELLRFGELRPGAAVDRFGDGACCVPTFEFIKCLLFNSGTPRSLRVRRETDLFIFGVYYYSVVRNEGHARNGIR